MDKNWLKNNFFNVINSNLALAQVFVVIFFFENYLIISQDTSLLQITVDFDTISLLPFVLFFVTVAVGRLIWLLFVFISFAIKHKIGFFDNDMMSSKVSFTAFLLGVLAAIYLYYFETNPSVCPIDKVAHQYWHRLFSVVLWLTCTGCAILSLVLDVQLVDNSTEK